MADLYHMLALVIGHIVLICGGIGGGVLLLIFIWRRTYPEVWRDLYAAAWKIRSERRGGARG